MPRSSSSALSLHLLAAVVVFLSLQLCSARSQASTQPYITSHQINFGTGNKYHQETDISIASPDRTLSFARTYNSQSSEASALGYGWSATFAEKLANITATTIDLIQADGRLVRFNGGSANGWICETGVERIITVDGTGYQLKEPDGEVKRFNGSGQLTSSSDRNNHTFTYSYAGNDLTITDDFGHSLSFFFNDTTGKLDTLSSAVVTIHYGYDNDNLTTVTREGELLTTYLYEDPNDAHNLTGITETGILAGGIPAPAASRILTVEYDNQDRAFRSYKTGGAEEVNINYVDIDTREITRKVDAADIKSTYELEVKFGIVKVKSFVGPGCSSCGDLSSSSYTYNDRFQLERLTNAEDVTTYHRYDSATGNRTFVTEAEGLAEERTTEYTYWPGTNRVWQIKKASLANPGQQHIITKYYDAAGNLESIVETGYADPATSLSRTTGYFYTNGQLTSIDGPRTDVNDITTLTYYPNQTANGLNRGQLKSISNPLGHKVTYRKYNALGQPKEIEDANGVITTLKYNSRGLVTSRSTGTRTYGYLYDSRGRLDLVSMPEGRYLDYLYDDSTGRLDRVTDNQDNYIKYAYDSWGKQTRQLVYNAAGELKAQWEVRYDTSGRLYRTINPDDSFREYLYDGVNNLKSEADELGEVTGYKYDGLNRLRESSQPRVDEQGLADPILTTYRYIAEAVESGDINNSVVMTDDNQHRTVTVFDDFGRAIREIAPDTGTTGYTYDDADNLLVKTTAKTSISYHYDALNRVTDSSSLDGTVVTGYQYDQNPNGIGRLTTMTDNTGSSAYGYNAYGELTSETRAINGKPFTTVYGYNGNGEITTVTYPSTRLVNYPRDNAGNITSITSTYQGQNTTLASQVVHEPFGPLAAMNLGNGLAVSRLYDLRYRLTHTSAGTLFDRDYGYKLTGQVEDITDNLLAVGAPGRLQHFDYNAVGRLATATGKYGALGYRYDGLGNRTAETVNGVEELYQYQTGSNRLSQVGSGSPYGYDDVGNITQQEGRDLSWDGENRLTAVNEGGNQAGSYGYDGRGLRTVKTTGTGSRYALYDLSGNLLSETTSAGAALFDYVYLDGERIARFSYPAPADLEQVVGAMGVVGSRKGAAAADLTGEGKVELADAILPLYSTIRASWPPLAYYINDHLATSQVIADGSGKVVWQGDYLPFGEVEVVVDRMANNSRFPGQYFDGETGLHYNWHRFYDPETGRYISADPIGLDGGMNLYAYVGGDPVNWIDPWGLFGDGIMGGDKVPGHSDFYGGNQGWGPTAYKYKPFDFTAEDHGITNPYRQPGNHFRPRGDVEAELPGAIQSCSRDRFQRLMHQGQDSFSHYDQGYRWPGTFGHIFQGTKPDNSASAWYKANEWTKKWVDLWDQNCKCAGFGASGSW